MLGFVNQVPTRFAAAQELSKHMKYETGLGCAEPRRILQALRIRRLLYIRVVSRSGLSCKGLYFAKTGSTKT